MTPDIEERLHGYAELGPDARTALEAEIARDHPEGLPLLSEMQTLAHLLDEQSASRPLTPEALARLAAHAHVSDAEPPALIKERLQRDADARHEFYELRDRIEALDRALPDPTAQFEALTGHTLEKAPALPKNIHRLTHAAPDRAPQPRTRVLKPNVMRYAVAACFGLVALYGGLAIASRASVSELDRLGALDAHALRVEGFGGTVRGETVAADPATNEGRYLRALDLLDDARHSTLGLFPRYDADALSDARRLLETVVLSEERGSFLQLEASYVLGKTLLLLGDEAQAKPAFLRVVEFGGRHVQESTRILASLEARTG